nr:hypothetical protein [Tanacetum cinerariifolium]
MEMLSDAAMLKAKTRKAIKASRRDYNFQQETSGSRAGIMPKVPDVSKASSRVQEINEEDWGSTKDDVIFPSDDERTNLKKETVESSKNDKDTNDDEEHNDVNVEMKHTEIADEGNTDEEMADAAQALLKNMQIHKLIQCWIFKSNKKLLLFNEDDMEKAKATEPPTQKKRQHDDKDQDPPVRPNQGMKKRKKSKDVKPSKRPKSTGSSKGNTHSQPKSTGSTKRKYTASTTKTKAAKYELKGIEDMVPKLWSPIKYGYGHLKKIVVRRAYQKLYKFMEGDFPRLHLNDIEDMLLLVVKNKLFNLEGDIIVDSEATLQPHTTHSDPQGIIYEDKLKRKRLMRSDKLYKFNDGTRKSIRNILHDRLMNFKLGYNKAMDRRKWTKTDKIRTCIMIKQIDKQMLQRRIMRSLQKFVGGREYGTDVRLLQQTI